MRDHDEQNGFLPVQNKDRYCVVESQNQVLRSSKIELWPVAAPQGSQISGNRLLLEITAHRWVTEQSKNIVLLANPVGDRIIAFFVIERMMIFVVGGNPTKSWKAIEQRQPVVRRNV